MKELITISALSLLLAAGCASRQTGRGGAYDTIGATSQDNSGAVHPGTTLGTNPSEDPEGSGSAVSPDNRANPDPSPGNTKQPDPEQDSPNPANPGTPRQDLRVPDDGTADHGLIPEGPGMFNLHHTILMIQI